MAKNDKINMPSSGAGLTRYFDGYSSNIMISPEATVFVIITCIILILGLKFYFG